MATEDAKRAGKRAWRPRPGGAPKPSLRETLKADYIPETEREATADELDRGVRWRHATPEERGAALADLLDFVESVGRFPPKTEMFPGWKRLVRKGPE